MKMILTLTLFVIFSLSIYGQNTIEPLTNIVKTTAIVDTLIAPDEIYLEIKTIEKDYKKELDKLEGIIVKKLQDIGIDTNENLKIDDFNSVYSSNLLFGKSIKQTKTYELKVTTAAQAIMVIDQLDEEEIKHIRLTKTAFSMEVSLDLKLREMAVVKARNQAEALAKPLGQKVGPAIIITDISSNPTIANSEDVGNYLFQQYSKQKNNLKRTILELKKIQFIQGVQIIFELQ